MSEIWGVWLSSGSAVAPTLSSAPPFVLYLSDLRCRSSALARFIRLGTKEVISRSETRIGGRLPLPPSRDRREGTVTGIAAQAFVVDNGESRIFPSFISGQLSLPPRAVKDSEGVAMCCQVFNIGNCQDGSPIEFSLADPEEDGGRFELDTAQRTLLGKGDIFYVPPGNIYRLENHSKTTQAELYWTIIKPHPHRPDRGKGRGRGQR